MEDTLNQNKSISFWDASKRITTLALPMAGTQLINVASGFLCMAMLAQLGHSVLAASALIFSIQLSIMVTGMSILYALSVLVGHAFGAKNYLKIGSFVQQGWTLALLISIPTIILFWHIDSILIKFGQKPEIVAIVKTYFHAYIWVVVPGYLATCNQQFGYAIHKKTLIIITSIVSVPILLLTAYAGIFGKWGMPTLGVAGLGYAIAAQYTFFFIFTTLYFYFEKSFTQYNLFTYRVHQNLSDFLSLFKIGWPISLQMGGEMLSILFSTIMVGWLGTIALAAVQVVNQYNFLIIIPIFALSQASGILIGHANGSEQFHEIKKLGNTTILLVLIITIIIGFLFILLPKNLASVYLDINNPANSQTLHLIAQLFLIVAFSQLFDGLRNISIGILRGLFDTRIPMYINLFIIWIVNIPLGYILAFKTNLGVIGIALGGMIGMILGAILMIYRWHSLNKKFVT